MRRVERARNSEERTDDLVVITAPLLPEGYYPASSCPEGEVRVVLPAGEVEDFHIREQGRRAMALGADNLQTRRGTFEVCDELATRDSRLMMMLLRGVMVVRCEHVWMERRFRYQAYSEHFDPLGHGEQAPEYECVVHSLPLWRIEWRRQQNAKS